MRTGWIAIVFGLASSCAGDSSPTPPMLDQVSDEVPPETSADLFEYLKAGDYTDMLAEPEVHGSDGPHGDVLVYINRRLAKSLEARSDSHPVGSAAVKELYSNGEIRGWTVEIKVADAGEGDAWYWYENFSVDNNTPVADGTGVSLCVNCHSGGFDFVIIPAANFGL